MPWKKKSVDLYEQILNEDGHYWRGYIIDLDPTSRHELTHLTTPTYCLLPVASSCPTNVINDHIKYGLDVIKKVS